MTDLGELWLQRAVGIMHSIAETQREAIEQAAQSCAAVIGGGNRVYAFGSGHSRIPCEELFPRYASFPGFVPMVELSTTHYTQVTGANGLAQVMFIERISGLAAVVLGAHPLGPDDALMVFSVSGSNALPFEMVTGAKAHGLTTIAVTSRLHCEIARKAGKGTTADEADIVIDLCIPMGEALVDLDHHTHVGPSSTLSYVTIVNMIKVRTAELLHRAGDLPPVITHAAISDPDVSARSMSEALADHARRLRGSATNVRPS